jgi:hypothetical protein
MEKKPVQPALINYGGAAKSSFDMTQEEFYNAGESIIRRAREKAFSKGLPIYFERNGDLYAEYPDGSIKNVDYI